jgi:hypothetical protein
LLGVNPVGTSQGLSIAAYNTLSKKLQGRVTLAISSGGNGDANHIAGKVTLAISSGGNGDANHIAGTTVEVVIGLINLRYVCSICEGGTPSELRVLYVIGGGLGDPSTKLKWIEKAR